MSFKLKNFENIEDRLKISGANKIKYNLENDLIIIQGMQTNTQAKYCKVEVNYWY